jgi:transaldolase
VSRVPQHEAVSGSERMTDHRQDDRLAELSAQGVAVWLDDLSRELLAGGELESLVADRHVVGITTNPTIFASALSAGDRYDSQLRDLARHGASVDEAVFTVTTDDVRSACDVLAPVYRQTEGLDGCVSIEVDPRLSRDTAATSEAARRLWETVRRDNLYVKIPATCEGLSAVTQAISEGISVNVTLIFSLDRYRAVMEAYLAGLEGAAAAGQDLSMIRSVASFFVSRVDSGVDARLDRLAVNGASGLKGHAAVANARLAYQAFEASTASPRWRALAQRGARPQRPLWASTGVKNPAYPDTMYVTELVAPHTVNTMPGPTLAAFADHGQVTGNTIAGSYDAAGQLFSELTAVGIDFGDVTQQLEQDGLDKFEKSWAELSATVAAELRRHASPALPRRRPGDGDPSPSLHGGTVPGEDTPDDVARIQRRLRILQRATPVLTGVLVMLGAQQSEQERPASGSAAGGNRFRYRIEAFSATVTRAFAA